MKSYILPEVTFARPHEITLMGWADRTAILGSPKARLVEGGQSASRPVEVYSDRIPLRRRGHNAGIRGR